MNNFKNWLHGLGAAVIGGASTAASAAIVDSRTFNFSHEGLIALSKISAAAALIAAIAYLKQSPLPQATSTVTATVTQTVSTDAK